MSAPSGTATGSGWSLRTKLLLGACALIFAITFFKRPRKTPPPAPLPPATLPTRLEPGKPTEREADRPAESLAGSYARNPARPPPVREFSGTTEGDETASVPKAKHHAELPPELPSVERMPGAPAPLAAAPAAAATPPARAKVSAPFGRLLKCVLVGTLDSATNREEPIVGLVTEPLAWNGHVVIPARTEVFGYASPSPVIDVNGVGRLVDTGKWTLVLYGRGKTNGLTLQLRGRALDRRETLLRDDGSALSWALDDGADGLIGVTLTTMDSEQIKAFAAAAVSGLAQGFSQVLQTQQAAPGIAGAVGATQAAPTLGNAALNAAGQGTVALMNQMAARIQQEIGRRGVYVRVPASKTFYLLVEQPIELAETDDEGGPL